MKKILLFIAIATLTGGYMFSVSAEILRAGGSNGNDLGTAPPSEVDMSDTFGPGATCVAKCGGIEYSCSINDANAQTGSVSGAGSDACYCGNPGEKDVEVPFCNVDENGNHVNGGVSDLELKNDLEKSTPNNDVDLTYPDDFKL